MTAAVGFTEEDAWGWMEALAVVRRMHRRFEAPRGRHAPQRRLLCRECLTPHPCATWTAVSKALGEPANANVLRLEAARKDTG